MSYLLVLLSFLFVAQPADPGPKSQLEMTVSGEVQLPADQVQFNINVNAEAKSPKAAYTLHKKREKALVDLLEKYDIKEKNIRYEPISIREQHHNVGQNKYDTTYVTRQSVRLSLSDFDVFEQIQIGLINHNYDDFSAHFSSSKMEQGKDQALQAALKKAKEKATLIAKEAGVTLGSVQHIQYSSARAPSPPVAYQAKSAVSSGSLLKYDQTITVSATISIRYNISEK